MQLIKLIYKIVKISSCMECKGKSVKLKCGGLENSHNSIKGRQKLQALSHKKTCRENKILGGRTFNHTVYLGSANFRMQSDYTARKIFISATA